MSVVSSEKQKGFSGVNRLILGIEIDTIKRKKTEKAKGVVMMDKGLRLENSFEVEIEEDAVVHVQLG